MTIVSPASLQRRGFPLALGAGAISVLLTFFIWFPDIRAEPLWYDEIASLKAAGYSLADLVHNRYASAHSPVYFILLKLWLAVTTGGNFTPARDEWLVRLPSLVMTAAAGAILAATAFRAWGLKAALFAAVLFPCNTLIGRYGTDARPYALLILALTVALWANVQMLSDRSPPSVKLWRISAAGCVVAAAAMPLGALAVAVMELGMLATPRLRTDRAFRLVWLKWRWTVWLAVGALVAALSGAIASQASDYWTNRRFPLGVDTILATLSKVYLTLEVPPWFPLAAGAVAMAFAVKTLVTRYRDDTVVLSAALAFPFALILIALSVITSLLVPRYFIPAIPGLVLLAAAGMALDPLPLPSTLVGIVTAAVLAVGAIDYRNTSSRTEIYPFVHFAELHDLKLGDAVALSSTPYLPAELYLGDRMNSIKVIREADLKDTLPESGPLWIFDEHPRIHRIKKAMGGAVVCGYAAKGVVAYVAAPERSALPPSLRECHGVRDLDRPP